MGFAQELEVGEEIRRSGDLKVSQLQQTEDRAGKY